MLAQLFSRNARRLVAQLAKLSDIWDAEGPYPALKALKSVAARYVTSLSAGLLRKIRKLDVAQFGPFKRRRRKGTLLIGYVDANLGIGESTRALALSLEKAQAAFALYPFKVGVETRRGLPFMEEKYDTTNTYDVNIIEVACDQLPVVFSEMKGRYFSESYNILRTYWELPRAPASWATYLEKIDEIWAPTQFVSDAFAAIFKGPILVVPPCIDVSKVAHHEIVELNAERYYFLFTFDYFSFAERKNPLGVIRAFRQAFPKGTENVGLIIKSSGAPEHYPNIRTEIQKAASEDRRILSIDRTLARAEILSLIRSVDCYVSLHRAEGFGLGMAEAMAFGKAVIGTNFSGNRDFLSERTGYPIPYTLRPLQHGEYPWGDGQMWAEPEEAAAVSAMRTVFSDRDAAAERAHAASIFVRDRFGTAHVGQLVASRIMEIIAQRMP